jgi:hypothetical protein
MSGDITRRSMLERGGVADINVGITERGRHGRGQRGDGVPPNART